MNIMTKEDLKTKLLTYDIFWDNLDFSNYIDLLFDNKSTERIKNKTQTHHIIPKNYYKWKKIEIDNSQENLIELYYKDHVLAHCYLIKCLKIDELVHANKLAVQGVLNSFQYSDEYELIKNLDIVQQVYETSIIFSDEHKKHLSESHKGLKYPNRKRTVPWNKGKVGVQHCSEMQKQEISKRFKSLKWYNNGKINVRRIECPEGFRPGRLDLNWTKEGLEKKHNTHRVVTEETKQKLHDANIGKTLSEEHKRKISEAHRGKKASPETIEKKSQAMKKNWEERKKKL